MYALGIESSDDTWSLWYKDRDSLEWEAVPRQESAPPHPPLHQWLSALNAAYDTGRITLQQVPGNGSAQLVSATLASTNTASPPSAEQSNYPWNPVNS